jgi:hypothetical protein
MLMFIVNQNKQNYGMYLKNISTLNRNYYPPSFSPL